MKIDGRVSSTGTLRSASKNGASKGSAADFAEALRGGDTAVGAVGGVAPLSGIEGLFALQEVGPDHDDARAQAQGEAILDRLDELRRGLLLGRIAPGKLAQLARISADAAGQANDPQLKEILRDIELRAQVELAKLEQERLGSGGPT